MYLHCDGFDRYLIDTREQLLLGISRIKKGFDLLMSKILENVMLIVCCYCSFMIALGRIIIQPLFSLMSITLLWVFRLAPIVCRD